MDDGGFNRRETMGSYEQSCIDYALHGDPERDHWDHEEAARYDRFDGMREEFFDEDPADYLVHDCFASYDDDHVQAAANEFFLGVLNGR